MPLTFVARFQSADEFLAVHQKEISAGGLLVKGAQIPPNASLGPCVVELEIGAVKRSVDGQLAASIPGVGVAVMFPDRSPLDALAQELRSGAPAAAAEEPEAPAEPPAEDEAAAAEAPPAPGTMAAKLRALTVAQKMSLAISGGREERAYLLRDLNKTLHLYVFKNPRIGLDEVLYAAKLNTLSPDALKYIAEHKEWGANPQICAALARNPKTPIPLVLKLLPRVPIADVKAIAKSGGRAQVVQAARKIINE